jgi:putative ABC transport system ATP-binding protein
MQLLSEVAKDPNRAVLAVTHDHRTLPYADRIVRIEDGRIHSDERPKKGEAPAYAADHDAHASHAQPASPSPAVTPDDDNPTTPKSLGRRFRIRRHA